MTGCRGWAPFDGCGDLQRIDALALLVVIVLVLVVVACLQGSDRG